MFKSKFPARLARSEGPDRWRLAIFRFSGKGNSFFHQHQGSSVSVIIETSSDAIRKSLI
jgi:hypothetical protein